MKNIYKKLFIITLLSLGLFVGNVYACGEISNLKVGDGIIKKTGDTKYLVTLKEGTNKVKIEANTDYDWVKGYEPREVSTNSEVELRVDGNKCGFGIYSYTIAFKFAPNLIAENTPEVSTTETTSESVTTGETTTTTDLELLDIKIKDVDFEFESNTYTYDLEVDADVEELDIETTKVNESDTVVISQNANSLEEGKNQVTVTVSNAEGTSTTYTFNVTRAEKKSDNNYLSSLKIAGYQLNFDPSTTSYNLTIGSENELDITVTPESKVAKYKIDGNKNLENGSVITIKVTAEDGSTQDYVIKITKKFNIMDYWMYLLIGGLVLLLIILLIIDRKIKKRKKKKAATPETVDAQVQTAGVSGAQVVPSNEVVQPTTPATPQQTNSNLQIITPTNIETPATPVPEQQVNNAESQPTVPNTNDNQGQTEVFKL